MIKLVRYTAAPIFIMVLWVFSSRPPSLPESAVIESDKVIHFLVYAVLSAAIGLQPVFRQRGVSVLPAVAAITTAAASIGLLDEINQFFLPGRDASLIDWFADLLGAAFGAVMYKSFTFRRITC